jgi:RNA polymerase sigma-70 factor (ECF subfamily)
VNTYLQNPIDVSKERMSVIQKLENDLIGYLNSMTRDPALSMDIAQESFLKAWPVLKQSKNIGSLKPYLLKIARNLAIDHFRKEKRYVYEDPRESQDETGTPETISIQKQSLENIKKHVSKIKREYREMLTLYYFNGLNLKEISRVLDIPLNTAITRLSRARTNIRNSLLKDKNNEM